MPSKVLVVDDEPDVVSALQFRLDAAGYEVLRATNGAEALELLNREKVDLILSDFMMPEMNGLELTRIVRSKPGWEEIKVVLFSVNTAPEFRKRALDLGAVAYLPKEEGASSIVERIYDIIEPDGAKLPKPAGRENGGAVSPLGVQVTSLITSLEEFLELASLAEGLPESSRRALASAKRIAEEIRQIAAPDAGRHEQPGGPHAASTVTRV